MDAFSNYFFNGRAMEKNSREQGLKETNALFRDKPWLSRI
jgi:hypothetical protein